MRATMPAELPAAFISIANLCHVHASLFGFQPRDLRQPRVLRDLAADARAEILRRAALRLDAELVREAALEGKVDLSADPFLKRVLLDEWDRLGAPFQKFLADNGLSGHLRILARRR